MKKLLLPILLSLFLITSLRADELIIPFPCFPQALQKKFAHYKMRLDLDPAKRNKKSWGYLKNEGAMFTIYTYKSVTQEEFKIILKIVREVDREQNKKEK